jgi:hypothetical protein
MKKPTILLFIVSLCYVSVWADDCDPQPTPIPTGGFKIRTFVEDIDFFNPTGPNPEIIRDPFRGVFAQFQSDRPGAAGNNRGPINGTTDQFGDINVNDGRAPARWDFRETDGGCSGQTITLDVEKGKERQLFCLFRGFTGGFNASPSAVEAESTPQTISVYGEGFSAAYGMPLIRYFDLNGVLVAEAYADQVAPDGTWLTGSTTDLSAVNSGQYTLMLCNANADGTWETLGATVVEVFHFVEPPPDPDPCGGGCDDGWNICMEQMPCNVY